MDKRPPKRTKDSFSLDSAVLAEFKRVCDRHDMIYSRVLERLMVEWILKQRGDGKGAHKPPT